MLKRTDRPSLFSATLDDEVADLVRDYQIDPVTIEVGPEGSQHGKHDSSLLADAQLQETRHHC